MMKRVLCLLLLIVPLATVTRAQMSASAFKNAIVQIKKFDQFMGHLNNLYIDTINNKQLVERAIIDILAELDPHSAYTSMEDMVQVNESFAGKFSGIGVQINTLFDSLHVVNVISGGPAEKVGILPDDRIVDVDGSSIVGQKQNEVVKVLRGPKGSFVNVGITRPGADAKLYFRIKRDDISIESVDAAYMITPEVGYIKVNRFAHTTYDEMLTVMPKVDKGNSLILDLRSNGGGLMNQAVDMAGMFLPQGALIVSTQGRLVPSEALNSKKKPVFPDGKLVVLIDEFSASASEIVAGALQDWDRAVIIGRRSFGKGLVQRQIALIDGSSVNITTSKYLTPTGRAIQRPFRKGDKKGYYEDLAERLSSDYTDSLKTDETEQFHTLILGKKVYGDGGIYPDYYVHSDTTGYTDYFVQLIRKGVISEYVHTYVDRHRAEIMNTYPDFESYNDQFLITDDMIKELVELSDKNNIERDSHALEQSQAHINKRVKANMASIIWGTTEALQVFNSDDKMIQHALSIITNWDTKAKGIAVRSIKGL